MKERLSYIDIGAGVMIIWLLIYHALWPMYETQVLKTFPWLFFFMPWFFYKSGYFFSAKPLREVAKKDTWKLLKPYVIWSVIGLIIYIIQQFIYNDNLSVRDLVYKPIYSLFFIGAMPINRSLWFIPVLFGVHLLATMLYKRISPLYIGICSIIIAMVIGVKWSYMPRPIFATAWGLGFYSMGCWLRKYESNIWVFLLCALVMVVSILFTDTPTWYDRMHQLSWWENIWWYPASIAGCVVLNDICKWLDDLRNKVRLGKFDVIIPTLKWVGGHSMTFYILQGMIYVVLCDWMYYGKMDWYRSWHGLVLVLVTYVIIIVPVCLIEDRLKNRGGKK